MISDQISEQIIEKALRAPVPGVFYLTNVLELIDNGFCDHSFAWHDGIHDRCKQGRLHIPYQFGHQVYALAKISVKSSFEILPLFPKTFRYLKTAFMSGLRVFMSVYE